jgi:hypothetical protein
MNNIEEFKTPVGQIGLVLHRGGELNPETGKVEGGEILEQIEMKNLIVNSASKLMAMRIAPGINPKTDPVDNTGLGTPDGLQYLAVGSGVGTGDVMNPQPADATAVKLRNEIARKEFTYWSYVDPTTGNDTATPTNILKLATTFTEAEAVPAGSTYGSLVEMGLFGGNATTAKDSGIMFNFKTFAVWNKPNDARLTITWKLTF